MKSMSLRNTRQLGLRAIVALLFVLVLAGCSTSTSDAPFSLTGVDWQWQNWTTNGSSGSETTTVPDPASYTVMFNTDGTLNGQADCNRFAGAYTQESGGIQIQLGPMTLAACGDDSLDSTYLAALGSVVAGGPDGTGDLALENAGAETRMIFSNPNAAAAGTTSASGEILGFPWWYWLLGVLLLALLIWLFGRGRKPEPAPAPAPKPVAAAKPAVTPAAAPVAAAAVATKAEPVKAVPVAKDDLTRIEGIGPKIAGVLNAAGITTFVELSEKSVDDLRRILTAADLTGFYGDPTTWPAQAELASAGDWDALQSMQDGLKGGRIE